MGLFVFAENNSLLAGGFNTKLDYSMLGKRNTRQPASAAGGAASSSAAPRVERKTMEKNRRNKMKYLYSMLNSIIPNNQDSKEAKSLPDQIDDATKYIKYLESRVKDAKEKLNSLKGKKRSHNFGTDNCDAGTSGTLKTIIASTKIDVRVNRSELDVTLISGISDHFVFLDVLRVIHEERAEVLTANFSVHESSVCHMIHAQACEGTEAATISERLRKLVDGSSPSSNDSVPINQPHQQHPPFGFDIGSNIWEFDMFHAWNAP